MGGAAPYTFRPVTLPAGLTLQPVSGSGGNVAVLGGTPTTAGMQAVTFQVVDSTNALVSNESYPITVN